MAEWSEFSKGSSLNCLEPKTFSAFRGNDGCLVEDRVDSADHDKAKQKSLFCQIFSVYVKENGSRGNVRPVPALLGDGQLLDLYQLFSVVKERGGYDAVSRKGLWDSVSAELGLDLRVLASVKLVYARYLSDFESWLSKTIEEKSFKNGNHGLFKSLPLDLEKEFRSLLCSNLKDKDDDFVELESSNIIKHIDLVNQKSDGYLLDTKNRNNKCEGVQHVDGDGDDDDDEKFSNGVKDDLAVACVEISGKEFNSRKRKREELSGMVNWMRHVAKYPLEPVAQPIPEPSKWKEYKGHGFFPQILRARDARSVRKHTEPNSGSSSQKVKMHPAMYDDHAALGHHGTLRVRCSERQPVSVKSRCSCCTSSCTGNGTKLPGSSNIEAEKCPTEKSTVKRDTVTENKKPTAKQDAATENKKTTAKPVVAAEKKKSEPPCDRAREKQVCIGPLFQAEVPQWTGVVSESDSKWVSTQVWPAKDDSKPTTKTDLIGRERREKCGCIVQGSVDCVRFHIAENRMKLKLELGSAFYHWRFDQMGEEVSLRWTADEEKKFKDAMKLKIPSQNKSFWNNPSKYFRKKTRKNIVSYYFNVYIIQLRSYQNRVTPKNVDSDDDEVEFGSFGDGFGMKAIKHPAMDVMECSENKQCFDFE